jgi:general secretion pathway protein A
VAGIREDLFTPAAMRLVHRLSGGVPRRINTLCERALLAIFSSGKQRAGVTLVWQAGRDVKGRRRQFSVLRWSVLVLVLAFIIALAYWQWPASIQGVGEADALTVPEPGLLAEFIAPPPLSQAVPVVTPLPEAVTPVPIVEVPESANEPPAAQAEKEVVEYFDLERLFRRPQQTDQVYRQLFSLWTTKYRPDSPPTSCKQAPEMGLRCLRDRGDWRQLEALNRPLLLRLVKEKRVRLLLLKLKEESLLVVDDGHGEALLDASALKPYWEGEYVMLWRPYGGVALIGDGSAGEVVTWLRQRLRQFDRQPSQPVTEPDRFDETLKRRIQAFQHEHGLFEDGVAGQQTLIYLNNLKRMADTPTLLADTRTGEG